MLDTINHRRILNPYKQATNQLGLNKMNINQTIDSTLAIITNCYSAGVTTTSTARLLSFMGDYTYTQDLMAAVYVDTLDCKAGLNDDVYKFARAVLTKLEQGV